MNRALVIFGEYDARTALNLLKVDVCHKPGGLTPRDFHGVGLTLRANRLILGKVMKERIVGARTHLADELGNQSARQPLREGELQLVARVNDAVDDDPILAHAVARGNCGEGFALHDKITV
ncbi:MAG: hypothetical protein EBW81_11305 [Gammaproteobacteria bacterium]|nr:hypothetical protein [Gammaproteobacteria bacterium]